MPDYPKCIRCGWCCIIAPCGLGSDPCEHLIIHEDMTTSCAIIEQLARFLNAGCFLHCSPEVTAIHALVYNPELIKREIHEQRKEEVL